MKLSHTQFEEGKCYNDKLTRAGSSRVGAKGLSIQQPWAWAILHAGKDIENRSWPTKFRGKFLIHTGKKFDYDGYEYLTHEYPAIGWPQPDEYEMGGIVGSAEIVDCVQHHLSKWFFGDYGFVLKNATPTPFRECKGRLGFFNV